MPDFVIILFERCFNLLLLVVRFLTRSHWPLFLKDVGNARWNGDKPSGRVLLYYKVEPFIRPWRVSSYSHTNLWEITEIVRILNRLGYSVDIVDRGLDGFTPGDDYELFIGLGAGQSGRRFAEYAKSLPSAKKILIAAGPEPTLSNRLVLEQYERFSLRHGRAVSAMRLTGDIDFHLFMAYTDFIFAIGEPHTFSPRSYLGLGKRVLTYLPSTSPRVRFLPRWIATRSRSSFLCLAGDGFICKGVDIVVEAFASIPEAKVYICGPPSESAFFEVLGPLMARCPNISYEGFIRVGYDRFEELVSECAYTILPSSSEGCATSVATAMRSGLVPIVTREVGIDVSSFGIVIEGRKSDMVNQTILSCREAMQLSEQEYRQRVWKTVLHSRRYSQESFSSTFESAVVSALSMEESGSSGFVITGGR